MIEQKKIQPFYKNKSILKVIISYCLLVALITLVTIITNPSLYESQNNDETQTSENDIEQSNPNKVTFVKSGDNLYKILKAADVPDQDISSITQATKKFEIANGLKVGKKLEIEFDIDLIEAEDVTNERKVLRQLTYHMTNSKRLEVTRTKDGFFTAKEHSMPLKKVLVKDTTNINNSFVASARKLNLSHKNITDLVNAYSYQLDFQRELKAGDKLTVITEKYYTEDGSFSHHGNVLYSKITQSKANHEIFRHNYNGDPQYFTAEGRSVKRSFLRTPLKAIRISSKFGQRKHPILGYSKMHKGVDFAAPIGTPIYAAGDAIVADACWKGGYGKYLKLKHSTEISTAYAHLVKYAKGIKKGSKVKQGQIIAYVGTTGRSTGPHLHYEVLVNNQHVNPLSIKSTPELKLAGPQLAKFNKVKAQVTKLVKEMPAKTEVALDKLKLNPSEI